jgi:acyl carrier protein
MFRGIAAAQRAGFVTRRLSTGNSFPGAFLNPDGVVDRVVNVVKSVKFAPKNVELGHSFTADYKFDSQLRHNLVAKLEEEFCVKIPSKTAPDLVTVRAVVDYFSTHPKAR